MFHVIVHAERQGDGAAEPGDQPARQRAVLQKTPALYLGLYWSQYQFLPGAFLEEQGISKHECIEQDCGDDVTFLQNTKLCPI